MGRNVQQCRKAFKGEDGRWIPVIDENRDPYPPNFDDVSRAPKSVAHSVTQHLPKTPRTPCFHRRADDGIRTRDLLITNQLLYQLSYVGAFGLGK